MIDAPQPTNRKLRRTALSPEPPGPPGTPVSTTPAEQAPLSRGRERRSGDCPATAATSVGAHIVRPGNPAAAQTPRATTTPTPEQAPLSKGAGRGASRGLGDCPATKCRFIQATARHRETPPACRFFQTAASRKAIPPSRPPAVPPPFDKGGKPSANTAGGGMTLLQGEMPCKYPLPTKTEGKPGRSRAKPRPRPPKQPKKGRNRK